MLRGLKYSSMKYYLFIYLFVYSFSGCKNSTTSPKVIRKVVIEDSLVNINPTKDLNKNLTGASIFPDAIHSDHCPILLEID